MNYFAYGSNLCQQRMEEDRGVRVLNQRVAVLHEYELRFDLHSSDGSAKANIAPCPGSCVWGVVYEVDDNTLQGLRDAEGYPDLYDEKVVRLDLAEGKIDGIAYVAGNPDCLCRGLPAYEWYLRHIIEGGRAHGLPPEYLAKLEGVERIRDPDDSRRRAQERFWF